MNRGNFFVLPLLIGVVSSLACSGGESGKRPRPAPLVATATVEGREVPLTVHAPVDLRPFAQADVNSKVLGYLDTLLVDRGDHVKKGQLLATVRPSDLPDQLATERASLAQIRANAMLAQATAARAQSLTESGLTSRQDLEQASATLHAAKAQESASLARISGLAIRLGETRIEAPMEGIISLRQLDPGVLVGPGGSGPILSIVQSSTLRVSIPLQEQDIRKVSVGQEAQVTVDAFPDRSFPATVARISPSVNLATRTLDAEILVDNQEGLLRPGMYGRGSIIIEKRSNVPVVPVGAVVINTHGAYAYVVDGEVVRRRELTLGVDGGTWLEISQGLNLGDRVVVAGLESLADGARIRVQSTEPPKPTSADAAPEPRR